MTCGGGIKTRQQEFVSDIIISETDIEEKECNLDACPSWGKWRAWTSCSAKCWQSDQPKPTKSRYRCWNMHGGIENCGSTKNMPGQGHLCDRKKSDLCYETEERKCNTGKFFQTFSIFLEILLKIIAKSLKDACSKRCEWSEWSDYSSVCTPNCAEGVRISRRSNNEDEGTFQRWTEQCYWVVIDLVDIMVQCSTTVYSSHLVHFLKP